MSSPGQGPGFLDPVAEPRAGVAFREIVDAALAAGGTVTGEHGVGTLKLDGLRKELSPASLALHHAVKGRP